MQNVCPVGIFFFSRTQDFAFASLEKMSTKTRVSVLLAGFQQVLTLQWKVWLKEVLTITENNIKMASGYLYTWFKDFESVFAFLLNSLIWTHLITDHYFGQFLVRLVVFLSDNELISLLLLKQLFIKPVIKFWDLQSFSTFKFSFFFFCSNSAAVFSCFFVFSVRSYPH